MPTALKIPKARSGRKTKNDTHGRFSDAKKTPYAIEHKTGVNASVERKTFSITTAPMQKGRARQQCGR